MRIYVKAVLIGCVAHLGAVLPFLIYHGIPVVDSLLLCMIGPPVGVFASRGSPSAVPRSDERFEEIVVTAACFPAVFYLIMQALIWGIFHIPDWQPLRSLPVPFIFAVLSSIVGFIMWAGLSQHYYKKSKRAEQGGRANAGERVSKVVRP